MNEPSVLQQRIRELAERHGSIRAAARVLEVDHAYLYRLSTGEKDDPGEALLRKLKLRRVVTYVRTDAPRDGCHNCRNEGDFGTLDPAGPCQKCRAAGRLVSWQSKEATP